LRASVGLAATNSANEADQFALKGSRPGRRSIRPDTAGLYLERADGSRDESFWHTSDKATQRCPRKNRGAVGLAPAQSLLRLPPEDERSVCYFLAIGGIADPLRLGAFFKERLDVDVAVARATILAAFPTEDVVRLLTRGGCSCELLEPPASTGAAAPAEALWLTPACRRVLAVAAAELGGLRMYLKSRREWRPGGRRLAMTIGELLECRAAVPADVLVDVVLGIPVGELN
jgi:hypothetical protein